MSIQIECQNQCDLKGLFPTEENFCHWITFTLNRFIKPQEVTVEIGVVIVDSEKSSQLNFQYRQKSGPTNVLSFNYPHPDEQSLSLIGDLVFCADIISRESSEQQKPIIDHWAHLTVHGVLHLLGYDHIIDKEAVEMENEEIEILALLGYNNPYES